MSAIPLAIQPPPQPQGPLQQAQGATSLQELINQTRLQQQQQQSNVTAQAQQQQVLQQQQIATQEAQQGQQDDQNLRKAFTDAGGDWDKTMSLAAQYGVGPTKITQMQLQHMDAQTKAATLTKDQADNTLKQMDLVGASAMRLRAIPAGPDRDAAQAQETNKLVLAGVPQAQLPTASQSDQDLDEHIAASKYATDQITAGQKIAAAKVALPEEQAKAAQEGLGLASQVLSPARSQPQWDSALAMLKGRIPDDVLNQLPKQFSPDNVKTVQQMGMTPQQTAQTPLDKQEATAWMAKTGGSLVDYQKYKAQQIPLFNFNLQGGAGGGLSSPALDQAANRYLTTGELPAMGMGSAGAAARKAIMNRAATLDPNGIISANEAVQKANSASLGKIQTQFDTVNAFENTAIKNLDRLVVNGQQIPDLGARFANVPVRMISEQMLGTPAMAKFKADLLTAQTESAKVLNSANATGVLSDSSRKEAQDILSGNLPFPAMVAAVNELKNDMGNRHQSYQDQISDIQGRLRNPNAPPAATSTATPRTSAAPTHNVGDSVSIKGNALKISKVYPDGSFDAK